MTTGSSSVRRAALLQALENGREPQSVKGLWRLANLPLTTPRGDRLTAAGRIFRQARPEFSLGPFDRASERYTAAQVRARDLGGREYVVARLGSDGKARPTRRSEAYFNAGQQLFVARLRGLMRPRNGGQLVSQDATVDDQWLRDQGVSLDVADLPVFALRDSVAAPARP